MAIFERFFELSNLTYPCSYFSSGLMRLPTCCRIVREDHSPDSSGHLRLHHGGSRWAQEENRLHLQRLHWCTSFEPILLCYFTLYYFKTNSNSYSFEITNLTRLPSKNSNLVKEVRLNCRSWSVFEYYFKCLSSSKAVAQLLLDRPTRSMFVSLASRSRCAWSRFISKMNSVRLCHLSAHLFRITPVNDWVSVVDSALSSCIKKKPAGQNLGMEAMLNVGCRKVGLSELQRKTYCWELNELNWTKRRRYMTVDSLELTIRVMESSPLNAASTSSPFQQTKNLGVIFKCSCQSRVVAKLEKSLVIGTTWIAFPGLVSPRSTRPAFHSFVGQIAHCIRDIQCEYVECAAHPNQGLINVVVHPVFFNIQTTEFPSSISELVLNLFHRRKVRVNKDDDFFGWRF